MLGQFGLASLPVWDVRVFLERRIGDADMARKPARRSNDGNGSVATMPPVSEEAVRELSQVFKLLSDETRLRILLYLAQNEELHVTDLCNRLGQSQPAVSHHLSLLCFSCRRVLYSLPYIVRSSFWANSLEPTRNC
jgi:hypothetical protein